MMAWYYKKQEEQKVGLLHSGWATWFQGPGGGAGRRRKEKLAEDDDDTYTSAAWASNKSLKTKFAGISAVRLP
ncbi:uncharacterized protein HaLaN_29258 [Haematococcus lacustris]|uniref:Uncharacterized protein n=1 Tax=Haematococcus lacustris TaxID=44745 RepID=A0A6A0ACC7_HAELA|nr:uncharacterized protein HaLaN_29258 [Haematococcus lacustris]